VCHCKGWRAHRGIARRRCDWNDPARDADTEPYAPHLRRGRHGRDRSPRRARWTPARAVAVGPAAAERTSDSRCRRDCGNRQSGRTQAMNAPMEGGKSVLIVDDSLTVRMDLTEGLAESGFEVKAVDNLASGRAALAERAFPLLILDVQLPDG